MPTIQGTPLSFPATSMTNGNPQGVPSGYMGELVTSPFLGKYSSLVKAGKVFSAYATLTAPVIYSTAAGTGGPLLWNRPSSGVDAHILAVGFSTSVVTTVAGGLGLTGGPGQVAAPTSTTAIDASGNMLIGGPASACTTYRVGTPVAAGLQLVPFAQVHTGALTVDTTGVCWVDFEGGMIVPPGSWGSVAGTASLTTLQVQVALIWAELPH